MDNYQKIIITFMLTFHRQKHVQPTTSTTAWKTADTEAILCTVHDSQLVTCFTHKRVLQISPFKTQPQVLHLNPFTHRTTKPRAVSNSCSPISLVHLIALLEIGTAVTSAVVSLGEHLSQTNTSIDPKMCYQSACCLIWYILHRTRISRCPTNSCTRSASRTCTARVSSRLATRVTLT